MTTMIRDESWIKDLSTAKALLNKSQGKVSSIDMEWLLDVIDMASHEERKELREGLEAGPRSLWYDYDKQCWTDYGTRRWNNDKNYQEEYRPNIDGSGGHWVKCHQHG